MKIKRAKIKKKMKEKGMYKAKGENKRKIDIKRNALGVNIDLITDRA